MTYVAIAQVVDAIKARRNRKKVFISADGGFDASVVGALPTRLLFIWVSGLGNNNTKIGNIPFIVMIVQPVHCEFDML
jgi:hypothetical protein